jgi:ArsR family transcriptional regulator, arsenate/arsenite/antimonite-responsive transcriptional repressor
MEKTQAIGALAALAHDTRLEVFRLLVRQGPEGMPAGDISSELDLAPATLSFHLNTLRHAGLVVPRRAGRQVFYSARYEAVSELMGFLMENCCEGHSAACAFLEDIPVRAGCR